MTIQQVMVAAALALQLTLAGAAGETRWNLGDLYPTPAAWSTAFAAASQRVQTLDTLREGATTDAAALRHALVTISDTQRDVLRLYAYASLSADEDLRNATGQERRQQVTALYGALEEKTAWTRPAILAAGDERVRGFIAADPVLKARFDHELDDILRSRPYTLNAEGEALLAGFGPALSQSRQVQSQLVDSELPRTTVTLADGKTVELTVPGYESARQSRVRADRKLVFDGFFGSLKKLEGTLGANLAGSVLADNYQARAHHFGSSLEAALFADAMPAAVYTQLVAQANAGLPTLHRYLKLRQRMLGIDGELAYYDNYPPVVAPPAESFTYEHSKQIALAALAPLGDEYLSLLKKGLNQAWVDVHPRPTKASGGYMFGAAYDVHPYLLLNHNDDFQSLSTLAHEWGHAVHTMLT
ncbi:MAG: M3 family metallopeptidase [Pseudomonadota bacterium]|nr:M3 family metallopeptidase [Pseudomonadota bacterium]